MYLLYDDAIVRSWQPLHAHLPESLLERSGDIGLRMSFIRTSSAKLRALKGLRPRRIEKSVASSHEAFPRSPPPRDIGGGQPILDGEELERGLIQERQLRHHVHVDQHAEPPVTEASALERSRSQSKDFVLLSSVHFSFILVCIGGFLFRSNIITTQYNTIQYNTIQYKFCNEKNCTLHRHHVVFSGGRES